MKFINTNIGLIFVLTILICAAGMESKVMNNQAFNTQDFSEVFGDVPNNTDASMFAQGQADCRDIGEPQSSNPSYLDGFAFQYEVEQISSARSR